MDPSYQQMRTLQTMPHDPLCVIVSKVGSYSAIDYCNVITACKYLYFTSKEPIVCEALNLSPIVKQPHLAKKNRGLFNRCLTANNMNAYYIKGLLSYFEDKQKFFGLHYLEIAFHAGHKEATFLFGVLHMSLCMIEKGKKIIAKLNLKEDSSIVETSLESIKASLARIRPSLKKIYLRSMEAMKPGEDCHKPGMEASCTTCINYDLVCKFVYLIMELNPAVVDPTNP